MSGPLKPIVVAHVLDHFGQTAGIPVEDAWTAELIDLIDRASNGDQARLALGFPHHVAAVRMYRHGGIEALVSIAKLAHEEPVTPPPDGSGTAWAPMLRVVPGDPT